MSEDFKKFFGYILVLALAILVWNSIGQQVRNEGTASKINFNQASVYLSQ